MDSINATGVEEEPGVSKGRVSEVGGGGADEEEEPDATAVTLDALSASDHFSNCRPIFFRREQSLVLWSILQAELWHRRLL